MNHGEQQTTCSACGAPIIFITSKKSGKPMPVDAKLFIAKETNATTTLVMSDGTVRRGIHPGMVGHTSHFATCPKAGQFRKPKSPDAAKKELLEKAGINKP